MKLIFAASMAAIMIAAGGCASMPGEEYPRPVLRNGEVFFQRCDFRQANILDVVAWIESEANSVLPADSQVTILLQVAPSNPDQLFTVRELIAGEQSQGLSLMGRLVTLDIKSAGITDLLEAAAGQTGLCWDRDSSGRKYRLYDPELINKDEN